MTSFDVISQRWANNTVNLIPMLAQRMTAIWVHRDGE